MVQKALKLEPYNSQLYAHAASIAMGRGKIEEGLKYIDKAIQVQPLRAQNYQQKADVYFQIGVNNLNAKKYNEAEKAFKEVLNIPVVMKEINKKILKPISLTSETVKLIEKSDYLLKNYNNINNILMFNRLVFHSYLNINQNNLPDGWTVYKPNGAYIKTEITPEGSLKITNKGSKLGGVNTKKFSLKSNRRYILQIKVRGQLENSKTFNLDILSDKGEHLQLHVSSIELESTEREYVYEFTTKDLEGKQYIRFEHAGNDLGYVEILEVNVFDTE
jgi:tetratricopeptide (TPR) repeat protein